MWTPDDNGGSATSSSARQPSKGRDAAKEEGQRLSQRGQDMLNRVADQAAARGDAILATMHRGGKVPRTGNYRLKKGERVTPARKGAGRKKGRAKSGRF